MALPEIAEARKLSDNEISEQINGTRRELFDLRFQQATSRLENPHRFRHARVKLAQLLTVQQERQRSTTTL
ncbi:MAG: 50S ribosomal protein L29 [Synechococcus sp. TMED19]|jgi:large subunit ribosomal protein L29|nr:MAG: 50S ribosomal protein L29 [Synechococcus sp. TMED19]|tara:strand:- start:2019 stop:2231 length:213 start_codon:yes stop_codon:yes gene_type:complete